MFRFYMPSARPILVWRHYLLELYIAKAVVSNEGDLCSHIPQTIYFSRTNGNKSTDRESL